MVEKKLAFGFSTLQALSSRRWCGRGIHGSLLVLAAVVFASGCAGGAPEPPRACLGIEAAERLNFYEGRPHVLVLTFFPLRSGTAFEAADPQDLLRGERPEGAWEITVLPGQQLRLDEPLPRETYSLGVVADFNRGPSRAVVEVSCGFFGNRRLILTQSDLQVAN